MEVEWMQTFAYVAELGSLTRASQKVHLSQPALSRHIQLLEEYMGADLFQRTGRGMKLTPAGRLLQERAMPLLKELSALPDIVVAGMEEVVGDLRVAFPPSFGAANIAFLSSRYREKYPHVRLRVGTALSGAVRDGILRGDLDLGVVYSPVRLGALDTQTLYREELWLVGAKRTGLRRTKPVPFSKALLHPLVLPSGTHGLRMLVEGAAAQRGMTLDVAMEVDSLQVLLELVGQGTGYCMLPIQALEGGIKSGLLSAAPIRKPTLRRSAVLAWQKKRRLGRAAVSFIEMIQTASFCSSR